MTSEWVVLAPLSAVMVGDHIGIVRGALKCRRVVQVRDMGKEGLCFCARVPLPKSVERLRVSSAPTPPTGEPR